MATQLFSTFHPLKWGRRTQPNWTFSYFFTWVGLKPPPPTTNLTVRLLAPISFQEVAPPEEAEWAGPPSPHFGRLQRKRYARCISRGILFFNGVQFMNHSWILRSFLKFHLCRFFFRKSDEHSKGWGTIKRIWIAMASRLWIILVFGCRNGWTFPLVKVGWNSTKTGKRVDRYVWSHHDRQCVLWDETWWS